MTSQRLCRLDEIPDGEARGFIIGGAAKQHSILVYRTGDRVFGYANSCPHVGSPLDWAPDRFIAPDGYHLLCATHGAIFRPTDGYCVNGPCIGDSLAPVPVRLDGMDVVCELETS